VTVHDLQDVIAGVQDLPVAAIVTDLSTYEVVAANDRAAELLRTTVDELVGTDAIDLIRPDAQDSARQAYSAMATRAVDGYHVVRDVVTPGGDDVKLHVWGRRVEGPSTAYGTWFLTSEHSFATDIEPPGGKAPVVLAVTDHDWQIEYMSADASLLGVTGAELRGYPLLGLVHPTSVGDLLNAADRAADGGVGVSVPTRIRVADAGWAGLCCLLVGMCGHHPPRFGVVISPLPPAAVDVGDDLESQARHCALEALGFETLDTLPALASLPVGNELSARQTQIVSRLASGEGVAEIARTMFLSASTVRNHLAAIFKKFGVHSQAELLAALLREATARDEW